MVKNTRPESASQRALRENALSATENRLPSTPKIQQSQYTVVELPDGQQILKKRNPSSNTNDPYVGHVLGRGLPYESINDDPSVRSVPNLPKANYFERRMRTESDRVQNTNVPMKPLVGRDVDKGITKKPNASFANYAYQPDPGQKLGRERNPTTVAPHANNGAIPRTRFHHDNGSTNRQPNQWDGTTQEFYNARYLVLFSSFFEIPVVEYVDFCCLGIAGTIKLLQMSEPNVHRKQETIFEPCIRIPTWLKHLL